MKEFIEKLIKRLNEKSKWVAYGNRDRDIGMTHKVVPFSDISDIVNELAEECKPKTYADRIRNMSDEELADMLHNIGSYVEDGDPLIDIYIGENKSTIDDSFGFILKWLQSESEG